MNVTIVGGGFGGVKTALELSKDKKINITLISDKVDFQYYPALYSAATGGSHLQSWVPLAKILSGKKNVTLVQDSITSINPADRQVISKSGTKYTYDECVIALGTVTTYFGIKGLDTYAYGIKSIEEVTKLTQHIHKEVTEVGAMDKRFIIIGAGPTGVELAAALGSYLTTLCRTHNIKNNVPRIELIEAAPRVMPKLTESGSAKVHKRLERLGIEIHLNTPVESQDSESIMANGKQIMSKTVVWTSGVANHPFFTFNKDHFKLAPNNRVIVDEHMKAADHVYVIGDNAATPFTGLAQTALHDAIFVGRNLIRKSHNRPRRTYKAVMPPVVIPVGRAWAIFEWRGMQLSGIPGAAIRRAADFMGYRDILPIGQALGVWRAKRIDHE
jgi:NADH dehydrogenase